jgi:hypothetical protein
MANTNETPRWNPRKDNPTDCVPWEKDQFELGEVELMFISLKEPDVYKAPGQAPGKPQWKFAVILEDEAAVEGLNEALGYTDGWLREEYEKDLEKTKDASKRVKEKAGCPQVDAKEQLEKIQEDGSEAVDYVPTGRLYVQCSVRAEPMKCQTKKGERILDLTPRVYEYSSDGSMLQAVPQAKRDYFQGTKAQVWVRPRMLWLADKKRYSIGLQPTTVIVTDAKRASNSGGEHGDLPVDLPVVAAEETNECEQPEAGDGSGYADDAPIDEPPF